MKEMTNLDTNVSKLTASTRDLFGLACSPKQVVWVVLRLQYKYYASMESSHTLVMHISPYNNENKVRTVFSLRLFFRVHRRILIG